MTTENEGGEKPEEVITPEQADAEEANEDNEEPGPGKKPEKAVDPKPSKDEPEEEPDGKPASKDEPESTDYVKGDDALVNQVIDVLSDAKVSRQDAEAIFKEAISSNDPEKIDKAALEKAVGKSTADLILSSISTEMASRNSEFEKAQAALSSEIYGYAGDEKSWKSATDWATKSQHFDAQAANELNMMLGEGGRQAKAAVEEIMAAYKSSRSYKEEAKMVEAEGTSGGENKEPLSRVEYFEAKQAEFKRRGGPRESVLAELDARRAASRT